MADQSVEKVKERELQMESKLQRYLNAHGDKVSIVYWTFLCVRAELSIQVWGGVIDGLRFYCG